MRRRLRVLVCRVRRFHATTLASWPRCIRCGGFAPAARWDIDTDRWRE